MSFENERTKKKKSFEPFPCRGLLLRHLVKLLVGKLLLLLLLLLLLKGRLQPLLGQVPTRNSNRSIRPDSSTASRHHLRVAREVRLVGGTRVLGLV